MFTGNKALIYGDNLTSYAQELKIISHEMYVQNLVKLGYSMDDITLRMLSATNISDTSSVTNQQSGGTIPTFIWLMWTNTDRL